MDITVNITPADLSAFNRYVMNNRRGIAERVMSMALWTVIGISVIKYFSDDLGDQWVLLACFGFGFLAALLYIQNVSSRINRFKDNGSVLGEKHYRITSDGIESNNRNHSAHTAWCGIISVAETPDYLYFFVDTVIAFIVTKRSFADREQFMALKAIIQECLPNNVPYSEGSRLAPETITEPSSGAEDTDGTGPANGDFSLLARNLVAGARLALMLPVDAARFGFSPKQFLLLFLLDVLIAAGSDFIVAWPDQYFSIYGLTRLSTLYLLFFFSLVAVAALKRDVQSFWRFGLVCLSAGFCLSLVGVGYELWQQNASEPLSQRGALIVWLSMIIWLAVIYSRVLRINYPDRQRNFSALMVLLLLNVAILLVVPNDQVWIKYVTPDSDATSNYRRVDTEATYYSQYGLLDTAYENLLWQRPGITDLYFLGFAGYAAQDVFMKEVESIEHLFRDRFDADGRSVRLVNNRDMIEKFPLANAHNLRFALKDMAAKMDVEEDILFLYLTSHGSKDAELSVRFSPLGLNDLEAPDLREILDESGIKWRVLVISACYSGSFIEHLKTPNTLVLTAAAKDRTSFGCSNARDYTYFGEAYFAHQLQHQDSFIEAFYSARDEIKAREQQENLTPSNPQIFIGDDIEAKLNEFQRRISQL